MEVTSVLQAPVSWAQRKDRLYITINVEDCTDINVQFGEKSVTFRATSKSGEHEYVANLDLFDKINVSSCRYVVFSRQIPMVVKKLHKGPYWPRLLSTTAKVHWVKTDFNKWKDENDSDVDDDSHRHNAEFEDMMHLMGNMGT